MSIFSSDDLRTFYAKVALFASMQIGVLVVFWWLCGVDANQYMAAHIDKQRALATTKSPRLVVVGGSNVAFGIRSQELGDALGLAPVNMGLMVRLGLDFMLNEIRTSLRAGDVVVISPEYELLWAPAEDNRLERVLELRPQSVHYLGIRHVKQLLDNGLLIFSRKVKCAVLEPDDSGVVSYSRTSFAACGDFTAHRDTHGTRVADPRELPGVKDIDMQPAIGALNRFAADVVARGGHVFFSFAPLPVRTIREQRTRIDAIYSILERDLTFPVLDHPRQLGFSPEDFVDTTYHLTGAAAVRRTEHLRARLSAHLRR